MPNSVIRYALKDSQGNFAQVDTPRGVDTALLLWHDPVDARNHANHIGKGTVVKLRIEEITDGS